MPIRRWPAGLALCLLLAACGTPVVNPVTGQAERTVMSEADELAQGRQAHAQVLAEYGAYANPRLQAYVDALGQKLAKQSHRSQLPWTFTVLDSPELNAFALPGGYVYVTRGLMAHLDSEAELAGVVGHEIGHVTARHGAQRATRQQAAGLGVLAATVLGAVLEGRGVSGATDIASQVSQGVAAGYIASYSREQELQADQLGAEYLARNRYDPQNMVDVIGVLQNQERFAADRARAEGRAAPAGANWLSSHPSNDRRLADIRQIAAGYPGPYGDDGRTRYLQAIDGLSYGDGRAQGVTRGRNFYHEDLGIALTAPPGWRVQNSAEAIALVSAAGDAALVLRLLPASAGSNHDEIIRTLVQPVDGRTERRSLNGLAATHFNGTRRNAQGQAQPVRVTVVTGPANRHYLLQYAARDAATLQRALAPLAEAETSFRALTGADRAAARPWVLKTVALPRGGFAELARSSPLPAPAEGQLRLINGLYGSAAEPQPGQLVKVVQ
ncbi:MAG: M48 family metalloprotease [Aquabacterium sp.]|nr:M48 family metalloprotease [Aquabacterium sp.]